MNRLSDYITMQLRDVSEANHWHAATRQLLSATSAAQAIWRPAEGGHTIYEIVKHLSYSCHLVARRMHGHTEAWNADESWPATPPTLTEGEWSAVIADLNSARAELLDAISRLDDEMLAAPLDEHYTQLQQALQTVHHEAFHVGQIAILRRLQGLEAMM